MTAGSNTQPVHPIVLNLNVSFPHQAGSPAEPPYRQEIDVILPPFSLSQVDIFQKVCTRLLTHHPAVLANKK